MRIVGVKCKIGYYKHFPIYVKQREVHFVIFVRKYAQLGYFVSRLKIEQVLLNVDMTVVEMEQSITIKIRGQLP